MIHFNDISHKAGDMAILESLKRMEDAAGDDDFIFRIGGDEFVLLTDSEDISYANSVAEKIKNCNGQTIVHEGQEIPLDLWVGIAKQEKSHIKYHELFTTLHTAIRDAKV